jgi:hypothetical protein
MGNVQRQFMEQIELNDTVSGKQNGLLQDLEARLRDKITAQTGLAPSEVTYRKAVMRVTLKGDGGAELKGVSDNGLVQGTIDAAVNQATNDGSLNYDAANVQLNATILVDAPYFEVKIRARSLSEEDLLKKLAGEETGLRGRYKEAMGAKPRNVEYKVITSAHKYKDGNIPAKPAKRGVLKEGASRKSLEIAVKAANIDHPKKVSVVYMATQTFRVYGVKQTASPKVEKKGRVTAVGPEDEQARPRLTPSPALATGTYGGGSGYARTTARSGTSAPGVPSIQTVESLA